MTSVLMKRVHWRHFNLHYSVICNKRFAYIFGFQADEAFVFLPYLATLEQIWYTEKLRDLASVTQQIRRRAGGGYQSVFACLKTPSPPVGSEWVRLAEWVNYRLFFVPGNQEVRNSNFTGKMVTIILVYYFCELGCTSLVGRTSWSWITIMFYILKNHLSLCF